MNTLDRIVLCSLTAMQGIGLVLSGNYLARTSEGWQKDVGTAFMYVGAASLAFTALYAAVKLRPK